MAKVFKYNQAIQLQNPLEGCSLLFLNLKALELLIACMQLYQHRISLILYQHRISLKHLLKKKKMFIPYGMPYTKDFQSLTINNNICSFRRKRVFTKNLLNGKGWRNNFSYFILNPGHTSNKPKHYLLNYGDFTHT